MWVATHDLIVMSDDHCDIHDIHYGTLSGYDRFPMCVEENTIKARERERVTRDETMEPW
jgi:hypothetical protein